MVNESNKIAVINPFGSSLGHSALYATKICQSLANEGKDVTLFTSSDYNYKDVLGIDLPKYKLKLSNIKATSRNKKDLNRIFSVLNYGTKVVTDTWKTLKFFSQINKDNTYSYVHMIGGETATSVIYSLFFFKGIKKFITVHNSDYDFKLYRNNSKIKGYYKFICKIFFSNYLLNIFDGVAVHGHQAKKDFEEQINNSLVSDKIFPINIGLSKVDDISVKKKDEFTTLLFFGVIRRDKGLDFLLDALVSLNSPKIKLKIVGNPSQIPFDEVMRMVDQTGLNSQIECDLRYVEENEIPRIFSECDYVVLPYYKTFKAQSVVLTLAAQYKRPVLSSNVGQNGFDIVKYCLGGVCESESVDGLKKLIQKALNGEVIVSNNSYEKYFKDHSWEMMAKELISMYTNNNIK
jgi:glycosyltransferase involved in cell wall biosynthesis